MKKIAVLLVMIVLFCNFLYSQNTDLNLDSQARVYEKILGPQNNQEWVNSLSTELDVDIFGFKIVAYQIRWFNGSWSSWYVPGVNDLYKKNNEPMRRFWACFNDHTFKIIYKKTKKTLGITPLAYWNLDKNANNQINDNAHGTLMNGAKLVKGKINNCVYLDGNRQHVRINDYIYFNHMNAFTLSAWINPAKINTYNPIISKVNPNRDFVLELDRNGKLNVHFAHSATYYHCYADVIPANQWTHVAAVWNNNKWQLYINGKLKGERKVDGKKPIWSGRYMGIGTMNFSTYFQGRIDEVNIFKKALTQEEMKILFNSSTDRIKDEKIKQITPDIAEELQ